MGNFCNDLHHFFVGYYYLVNILINLFHLQSGETLKNLSGEVLRQIKETHPNIEVIILTGHGSEKDRQTCMELGAFAYLQKPVDIELLIETMKQAYAKFKERKA